MICSGEFGGLHFFNAGNLVSRGEFIHQRRVMKCWVLIYVLSGRLDISSGGICRSVASGEWLFLKPGEEHFGTAPSEGELSYLWAHFSPETPFFEGESGAAYTLPEYGRASSQRIGVIFRQLVDSLPQEHVYHAHGGMRPGNAADRTHPGAPGFLRNRTGVQPAH